MQQSLLIISNDLLFRSHLTLLPLSLIHNLRRRLNLLHSLLTLSLSILFNLLSVLTLLNLLHFLLLSLPLSLKFLLLKYANEVLQLALSLFNLLFEDLRIVIAVVDLAHLCEVELACKEHLALLVTVCVGELILGEQDWLAVGL